MSDYPKSTRLEGAVVIQSPLKQKNGRTNIRIFASADNQGILRSIPAGQRNNAAETPLHWAVPLFHFQQMPDTMPNTLSGSIILKEQFT